MSFSITEDEKEIDIDLSTECGSKGQTVTDFR